ncbi:MAG: type II toxin-antitoxin system RelE/ParE family toxin [Nitrospirae bacterium]|nr:type II toxin-antitoxin system RelE/ParE family toxin [Nitrospirota bacterium]
MPSDFRIFETRTFRQDLEEIRKSGLPRLIEKLQEYVYPQLRKDPRYGPNIKRLINWEPPTWRCRVGSWRFFYEVDEKNRIVYMTAADHRSRAYR